MRITYKCADYEDYNFGFLILGDEKEIKSTFFTLRIPIRIDE